MARRKRISLGRPQYQQPISSDVDLHGVGARHWELLALLAQYAVLDTGQVVELMFDSRPAAVRHLGILVKAGLVRRFVFDRDPSHRARYVLSSAGIGHLAQRLRRSQTPVPISLGQNHADQFEVNDFMIRLFRASRASQGSAWLYGWRPGTDIAAWLFQLGISWVQPRAAGVWLQDGQALRFLLHVDNDSPAPLSGDPAPRPALSLNGYRHAAAGVPANCLLVLCPTAVREQQLHEDIARSPLPLPLAATTRDRLYASDDPSGPIWTVPNADGMVRLIDLAEA